MALDAFIQFDGISGESLDDRHKNWIEVLGYNFGTHQSASATASSAGGASSGRTTVTPSTSPNSSMRPVRSFCRQAVQASTFQR